MYTHLRSDLHDDGVLVLRIHRPDKLNALNDTVLDELETAFEKAASDDDVRGIVLTGSGDKSFVAGADISQFAGLDASSGERFARRGQKVFSGIEASAKPVVAAVNGFALGGGCELAMACHLRVASDNAQFGQPEVNLGIIPGYGGTQRLPRLVGRGVAAELILTGERVDAQRAYEIGLVNRVVSSGELMEVAEKLVRTIARNAPQAVRMSLEALKASDLPQPDGLDREATLFGEACATEDAKEGAQAFLERRKPVFTGK